MSAPPRPDDHNFFLLLELDPEEDREVTIRAQIRKKRGEWSNDLTQGTEAVRNRAKTYQSLLARLEEVMTDPGERATERAWAREIRETRRRAGRAELARRIAAIRVRGGPYTARDLAALEREFGGALSRTEIERELVGAGVAAAEAAEAPGERAPRPALDPAKAKGIRQMLDEIGCADLYQFLGLGPGCTHETLGRRAEEILQEVYASGKRDQASSVRQNLAGRCKDVFRTPGEKERYDNSLATENLGRLDALIHLSGETGVVTAESLDFLVRQALELKIPREDVEAYVRAFAHRRKWRWLVAKGARLASDELRTCGACGRLAQDPAARNCGACGEPLTLACPQCGASVPTQNAACAGCGFRTGDAKYVRDLLARGRSQAEAGDFAGARGSFDAALACWPAWEPAEAARRALREREEALRGVQSLLDEGRAHAAEAALARVREVHGHAGAAELDRRAAARLREAGEAFAAGERLRLAGRADDAFDRYQQALLVCADHPPARLALAALSPPAPTGLKVESHGGGLRLRWSPVSARGAVRYQVVRKAGGVPAHAADGTQVGEVAGVALDDPAPGSGTPWCYAVFARRGEAVSEGAASSGPHLLTADPGEVRLTPGDGSVDLHWRQPPGCTRVEVWRAEGREPAGPGDGVRVHLQGDAAHDAGLANGVAYGYLLVAVFADPARAGAELRSPGVRRRVVPNAPPPPVRDLRVRREGRTALLSWTPPAAGRVEVRQSTTRPSVLAGQVIALAEADRLGAPLPGAAAGAAQAALGAQDEVFFTPLSIAGDTAVVGEGVSASALADVAGLAAHAAGRGIVLTWEWPQGADEVRVCWSAARAPEGPADPGCARARVTRQEYERRGCWELEPRERGRHYFAVYVKAARAEAWSSGAGTFEGMGQEVSVAYRVARRGGRFGLWPGSTAVELECRGREWLTGMQVVGRPGGLPLSPEQGTVLVEVAELRFAGGKARIEIPPEHCRRGMYVKLFFRDAAQCREVRLLPARDEELRLG